MNVKITLSNKLPFESTNIIPTELNAYHIPGTDISYAGNDFGKFLLQLIKLEKFFVAFAVVQTNKDVLLTISSDEDMIFSHIALNENFRYLINGKTINIPEGKFNLYITSMLKGTLGLASNSKYISLILVYPENFIKQQLAYFPLIENFRKNLIDEKFSELSSTPPYVSAKMFDCIHYLLHSPYAETTHRFHTDIVKKLLKLMLQQINKGARREPKYSLEYLEQIYAVKKHIDNNLLRHETIYQMARKVGINALKLKKGFKEVFGTGVYGYRKQERLKIAKAALEQTTKPIKEIAKNTGYKNANNFSNAFKKMFSTSPSELRKNLANSNLK